MGSTSNVTRVSIFKIPGPMSTHLNKVRTDLNKPTLEKNPYIKMNFNTDSDLSDRNSLDTKLGALVFVFSLAYATLRYNIFNNIVWTDWPLYILNKAFALSSLILIGISIYRYRFNHKYSITRLIDIARLSGTLHIIISLTLITPTYYEKFFQNGKFTVPAAISILLGALTVVLFSASELFRKQNKSSVGKVRILAIMAFLIGLHTAFQGFQGWLTPSAWPGYLPPITLISFIIGLAALIITFGLKRKRRRI